MYENNQVSLANVNRRNYLRKHGHSDRGEGRTVYVNDPRWAKGLDVYLPSIPLPEEMKQQIRMTKS